MGWLDGAVLAAGVGISSASFENAEDMGVSSPGALIRARVAGRSPLADGVGRFTYPFWESRYVMQANGALAPIRFPAAATEDFFVLAIVEYVAWLNHDRLDESLGDRSPGRVRASTRWPPRPRDARRLSPMDNQEINKPGDPPRL